MPASHSAGGSLDLRSRRRAVTMAKQGAESSSSQMKDAKVIARPSLTPSSQGGAKAAHGPPPHPSLVQSGVRWLPLRAPPVVEAAEGRTALQEKRMAALEVQVAELNHAYADDLEDMRVQMAELQDKMKKLQAGEPPRQSADAAARPRWSDQLGDDDLIVEPVVHDSSRAAVVTADNSAQTDEDGQLAAAAKKLDESLTEALNLQHRRHGSAVEVRKLTLAAGELLRVLGYRHASADATGVDDQGVLAGQSDEKDIASNRRTGELNAADTQSGARAEHQTDLDMIIEDGEHAAEGTTPREQDEATCNAHAPGDDKRKGRLTNFDLPYLREQLRRHDCTEDDWLEAIIFDAQVTAEKEWQASGWPIELPKSWYWGDPKRAVRCLLRGALQRDPSSTDMQFKTESTRSGWGERPSHRSQLWIGLWNDSFKGPPCTSVALAERATFRQALDRYQDWIAWQDGPVI